MGLKVNGLVKKYGEKTVVNNISFSLDKPGVFGLLGTNGAGKTTTIRIILGILNKNIGEVSWNDKEIKRENVNFGYLPEERGIYPKIKIYNQLMYFAELKGMKKDDAEQAIDYWLKKMQVDEYKYMLAEKLSKGNQQKIQFITAVMHNPELIILDEPFSGLDPVNTEILKEVIEELVAKGKYIIMSAHQMGTIEEFCSDIIIMDKGNSVLQGNLREIKESYPSNEIELISKENVNDIIKQNSIEIISNNDNNYNLKIDNDEQAQKLYKDLALSDKKIIKFEVRKPSLNEIFIEKVGENI